MRFLRHGVVPYLKESWYEEQMFCRALSTDYVRTGAAFSVIAVLLSAGSNFFTWYSINEPRYMFKRVAGSLHLITGEFAASWFQEKNVWPL